METTAATTATLVARRRGDNAAHQRTTDVSLGARYSDLLPDHFLQLLPNRGCLDCTKYLIVLLGRNGKFTIL